MSVGLLRFETIIEKLRDLDTEMQMQSAMTLSIIARVHLSGGVITVKEIGEKLGLSSASASRNIAVLSKWNRHDVQGHNLVEAYENPQRRVEKFVKLTRQGEKFIQELDNIVTGKTETIDVLALGASPNKQKHLDKMQARLDQQRKQAKEIARTASERRKSMADQAFRMKQERDA